MTEFLKIVNRVVIDIKDITDPCFKDFYQMKSVLESGGPF